MPEFGDRVGVLCPRADFTAVRRFFGDSIKGVADVSYISLGVGAAMGLLVGLIPLPIPGVGRITLGLAGVLVYANRSFPTERPDLGYAMVFPTVTVVKILFVQIAAAVLRS